MAVKECCCGKLSHTKKSIFGLSSQILYLVFAASFLPFAFAVDTNVSCSAVKDYFKRKELTTLELLKEPSSGETRFVRCDNDK